MPKRKNHLLLAAAGGLAAVLVLAAVAYAATPGDDRAAATIGVGFVELGDVPRTGNVIDAFVATGSDSRRCLVSFAESNFAVPGSTVYCNRREMNGQLGVRINVFFPEEPPADLVLGMTIYQQFAKSYGEPVQYSGP